MICVHVAPPPKTSPCTLLPGPDSWDKAGPTSCRAPAPSTAGCGTPEFGPQPSPYPGLRASFRQTTEGKGRRRGGRKGSGVPGPRLRDQRPAKSPTSSPVAPRHQWSLNIARVDGVIKRALAPGEAA